MRHLAASAIERFVHGGPGELAPDEEEHLLSCGPCSARMAEEARLAESMRRSADELDTLPGRKQNGFLIVTTMVLVLVVCGARLWPASSAAAPPPSADAGPGEVAGPLAD